MAIAASLLGLFSAGQAVQESGRWLDGFHLTYLCIGLMSMLAALILPSWPGRSAGDEDLEPRTGASGLGRRQVADRSSGRAVVPAAGPGERFPAAGR